MIHRVLIFFLICVNQCRSNASAESLGHSMTLNTVLQTGSLGKANRKALKRSAEKRI